MTSTSIEPGAQAVYRKRLVTVLKRMGKGYRVRFTDTGGHTRAPEHGLTELLPCGCPKHIVTDEGHQEGCDLA